MSNRNNELISRQKMAAAQSEITNVMHKFTSDVAGLTALEWANVLNRCAERMIAHGIRGEWNEPSADPMKGVPKDDV